MSTRRCERERERRQTGSVGEGPQALPALARARADGTRARAQPKEARLARQSPPGALEGPAARLHRTPVPQTVRTSATWDRSPGRGAGHDDQPGPRRQRIAVRQADRVAAALPLLARSGSEGGRFDRVVHPQGCLQPPARQGVQIPYARSRAALSCAYAIEGRATGSSDSARWVRRSVTGACSAHRSLGSADSCSPRSSDPLRVGCLHVGQRGAHTVASLDSLQGSAAGRSRARRAAAQTLPAAPRPRLETKAAQIGATSVSGGPPGGLLALRGGASRPVQRLLLMLGNRSPRRR